MTLPIQNPIDPALPRAQVFRQFWLPAMFDKPAASWDGVATSILRELYPGVWRYGPCYPAWEAWSDALRSMFEAIPSVSIQEDKLTEPSLVSDLVATYKKDRWVGYDLTPTYIRQASSPEWLNPTYEISRSAEYDSLVRTVLEPYQFLTTRIEDIDESLQGIALFMLMRYLPVDKQLEVAYLNMLDRHNAFSARWGLPEFHPADEPKRF